MAWKLFTHQTKSVNFCHFKGQTKKALALTVYHEIFSFDLLDNKKTDQVSLGSARHSIQPLNPYDQGTHCRNLCILQYLG